MPIYRIADLNVQMNCGGRTQKQAIPYLTEDTATPDITIQVNPELFRSVREQYPNLTDDEWEHTLSATSFYRELIRFDGFLLHASALIYEGRAYLFSAPSGTGKSTHTSLWIKHFGKDKVKILNDDKPAIRRINDRFYAYGTPWSGKDDISQPIGAPLAGICFITRAEKNSITRLTTRQALPNLFSQTLRRSLSDEELDLLSEQLSLLLCDVPIYQLYCKPDIEAAILAEKTMNRSDTVPTFSSDTNRTPYTVRDGYTLRIRAGSNIIACQDDSRFIGVTTLNSTGVFLFRILLNKATEEELIIALMNEYDIERDRATSDVSAFLKRLCELGILQK